MSALREWYEDWFDEDYLELYAHRDIEESRDFLGYLSRMNYLNSGLWIADLACGAGRYSWVAAREHGLNVVGVDLSRPLLNQAVHNTPYLADQSELKQNPCKNKTAPMFIQADIRALPLKTRSFELLLCMFTSFGYLPNDRLNKEILVEFERILKSEGILVLDLMNEYIVRQNLVAKESKVINGKDVYLERWIDEENRRVEKEIKILIKNGEYRKVRESVRLFELHEIKKFLREAGFNKIVVLGNYHGCQFDHTSSPRMILLAEK